MNLRLGWFACVMLVAAAASGCCGMDRYYHGHCEYPVISARHGDPGCSDGACGGGCASGSCGEGCGDPTCAGCADCHVCCISPIRNLWYLLNCSNGCGEYYFDEWINDPPDACDPCDDYGCYTGRPGCCPPRFAGLRSLFGYRCGATCDTSCGLESCSEPGCTTCGHGGERPPTSEPTMADPEPESVPTPMPQARRTSKPYSSPASKAAHSPPRGKVYSASTRTTVLPSAHR